MDSRRLRQACPHQSAQMLAQGSLQQGPRAGLLLRAAGLAPKRHPACEPYFLERLSPGGSLPKQGRDRRHWEPAGSNSCFDAVMFGGIYTGKCRPSFCKEKFCSVSRDTKQKVDVQLCKKVVTSIDIFT